MTNWRTICAPFSNCATLHICHPCADFIGQRGFRSVFEVVGALLFIGLQQPLLALVSFAITPALSRLLRSVVVRSSSLIYRRQQVGACKVLHKWLCCRLGCASDRQALLATHTHTHSNVLHINPPAMTPPTPGGGRGAGVCG